MKQWILKLLRRHITEAHVLFFKAEAENDINAVNFHNGSVASLIDVKVEVANSNPLYDLTGYTAEEITEAWGTFRTKTPVIYKQQRDILDKVIQSIIWGGEHETEDSGDDPDTLQ